MKASISAAKVHFVAGKGGVGKTLVSQALARIFARDFNTLLVELSEEESESKTASSPIINIGNNLSSVKIYPDQAIQEYLSLKMPTKKMLDAFLGKTVIKALCAAMPGLSDLTRLGKIWFHADGETPYGQEIFDRIVVDMPSSGFVGRFLSIASVVEHAVKIGPIAKEARIMNEYFVKHARLHLATMLEDLIVNETIEFWHHIKKVSSIPWGALFINRIFPLPLSEFPILEPQHALFTKELEKLIEIFKQRVAEESCQRERFKVAKVALLPVAISDRIGEQQENIIVDGMIEDIGSSKVFQ